jgi:hypothetical protein
MGTCEEVIQKLDRTLPNFCTVKDLIKIGLFKSPQAARSARLANCAPPFFKMGAKTILFPKEGVIKWLRRGMNDSGEESFETDTDHAIEKIENVFRTARLA